MSEHPNNIYFTQIAEKAVFAPDGPKPHFVVDTPGFKVLVAGLEAGQHIPPHPDVSAMYHFLEGSGTMTVGDESYIIQPGFTVVVPDGASRGMHARTRLVFLGSKGT